jgi:transglutaminase-like putative cysteine protease
MSIQVALHHHTEYNYDRLVGVSPQVIRLRPAPHTRTPVLSYSLKVEPAKHFINWQQDPFGNFVARLVFPERLHRLIIDVDVVVEMTVINPFDFFLEEGFQRYPYTYPADLARDLAPYLRASEDGPALRAWLDGVSRSPTPTVDFLVGLNRRLQQDVAYVIRMQPRFRMAAGADPEAPRAGRALRLRLPGAAHPRPETPRRTGGPKRRLHRPARLGRGLCARRGLGRA